MLVHHDYAMDARNIANKIKYKELIIPFIPLIPFIIFIISITNHVYTYVTLDDG
jgi:hypothetical protein